MTFIETPHGTFGVLADASGAVLASGWTDDEAALVARIAPTLRHEVARRGAGRALTAARDYYAGDLSAIDSVVVRQPGTAFREAGWATLRAIRPGAPLTYTAFAARMSHPRAVRAAASVCAENAAALFVPCHRVVPSGGGVGRFAWGSDIKRALLAHETDGAGPGKSA